MSGGFTPEFLEELKYKCDIVEVISQYVPLQKKGGRYFGCCPFHHEKTASFCVNQQGGFYHCFGCGASGDVIRFIQEIESVGFFDAVKYLASKVGLPLPEVKIDPDYNQKKERREVLKEVMREAAKYYRQNLLHPEKGEKARQYLAARGLDDEVSKRYGLGLSLDYDGLVQYLRYKGYKLTDLFDCGLISSVERPSDAFANRIIVPIINSMDEVVAFGGRIYQGETETAKYKNSTNTQLFDKGRIIFGLNYVKHDRRQMGGSPESLILVEGYMDVIALGAAGIYGAVAGMGTALTDGQARDLKRLSDKVYVSYDGDGAGQKAALKNLDALTSAGLEVKVVTLPDGKDPDETVRSEGKEGFLKYLDEALPVIEYKLKRVEDAHELDSLDGRAKYARAAAEVLRSISDPSERAVYASIVADKSRLSVDQVNAAIVTKSGADVKPHWETVRESDADVKTVRAARIAIKCMMDGDPFVKREFIKREWLPLEKQREIFDYLVEIGGEKASVGTLMSYVGQSPELDALLGLPLPDDEAKREKIYEDCLVCIADGYISARLKELNKSYASLSDRDKKRETVVEIAKLQKKLKARLISEKI